MLALLSCYDLTVADSETAKISTNQTRKVCNSRLPGDYSYETCGGFCQSSRSRNNCWYCKCRACTFCMPEVFAASMKQQESTSGTGCMASELTRELVVTRAEQQKHLVVFAAEYARAECTSPAVPRNGDSLVQSTALINACEVNSVPMGSAAPLGVSAMPAEYKHRIVYAHTSPRGIGNQFHWTNCFLEEYRRQANASLLLPVFELAPGRVVPFGFIFNHSSLLFRAPREGLRLLGPRGARRFIGATAAVALYTVDALSRTARHAAPRIVRVDHYKHSVLPAHSVSPWLVDLQFSARVLRAVQPTINFLRRRGYIGVHYRVETAAASDREPLVPHTQRQTLFRSVADNAQAIAEALHRANQRGSAALPCQLYVASYLPAGPVPALALLGNLTGGNFTLLRKFDFFPKDMEERPHMHRNLLAVLEWAILEGADMFIGHCTSSMSKQIAERRRRRGRPSELLFCPSSECHWHGSSCPRDLKHRPSGVGGGDLTR